jgi:pimeloyl-ACP methyl ester carboxylesterase
MKMKLNKIILLLSLVSTNLMWAQKYKETEVAIPMAIDSIYGTLLSPDSTTQTNLVIIIPGSGPTDRNGNQGMLANNSLKFLAEALSENGLATYRFDQSVISQSKHPEFKEENYTFNGLVDEVHNIITFFRNTKEYNHIILAGHSQGSLVGLLAAQDYADAYISLNGAGQSIDRVLYDQLMKQVPQLEESFSKNLEQMKTGEPLTNVNPMLASIFRPSVQPFLNEWMQHNPQEVLSQLKIPSLVIGGTKDIQVNEKEASILVEKAPLAKLVIIENMNHIFKEIKGEDLENQMSYMNKDLPVMQQLIAEIMGFLEKFN